MTCAHPTGSLIPGAESPFCNENDEQAKDRSYIRVIVKRDFLPRPASITREPPGNYRLIYPFRRENIYVVV